MRRAEELDAQAAEAKKRSEQLKAQIVQLRRELAIMRRLNRRRSRRLGTLHETTQQRMMTLHKEHQ